MSNLTKDEFIKFWGLRESEALEILDRDGVFVAGICAGCGKVIPSGATCNGGLHQPEYCGCWAGDD